MTTSITVPEKLKGADRQAIIDHVSKLTTKQISDLAPLAAKDPMRYSEKLQILLSGQTAQIDGLYKAVKLQETADKAASEQAEVDAAERMKVLASNLKDKFTELFAEFATQFKALPDHVNVYAMVHHIKGEPNITTFVGKTLVDKGKDNKESKSTRGRASKWESIKVWVEKDGDAREFDSISEARVVFTKPSDQDTTYAMASFTKQCENYNYRCEFVEKGTATKTEEKAETPVETPAAS